MVSKIAIRWATVFMMLINLPTIVYSENIGLDEYLRTVQSNHPFFAQQGFNGQIEREQQRRFLGDEDWLVKASTRFRHDERSGGGSILEAQEHDTLALRAGLERTYWANGSRLSIDYNYFHSDQRFAQPIGVFDEHGNGVSVTYEIPLMKNKGGVLSRLDYELQAFSVDLSEMSSVEEEERFLEEQGLLFLDWVFVTERRRIAVERLALAEEELTRTQKKRRSRLVAKVDVLHAQDAVISAKQNLGAIEARWRALRVELATHSADPSIRQKTPRFDLYRLNSPPSLEMTLVRLHKEARPLHAIDLQVAQLEYLKGGLNNKLEPELDLMLGAGLHSESNDLSGSARFDKPQYMIGINFHYPLGQRRAKADVSKVRLQQHQLREARNSLGMRLEAQLSNVIIQLEELVGVVALNQEQIRVARERTAEELKRHNQGHRELSFVIQSRNNEQYAWLAYAANAIKHHRLWLHYMALTDQLLTGVAQERAGSL